MREGVERFNRLEFWEAHDSWEKVWLVAQGDEKRFAQGLIQLAAAYLHVRRGTGRPAVRLFEAGLEKLSIFDAAYAGVDRSALMEAAVRHLEWLRREGGGELPDAEFPRLGIADVQP
ncbi:MAG: DUF309 domain-containing protein [Thermoanaerobaculia bacterium]